MKEFIIYPEEKKVECTITLNDGKKITGVSKCASQDKFDQSIGKKIANLRATLEIRKLYLKELNKNANAASKMLSDILSEMNRVSKNVKTIRRDIDKLSGKK